MSQGDLTVRLSLDDREYLAELGRAVRRSEREFDAMARSVAEAEAARERAGLDAARRTDQRIRMLSKGVRVAGIAAAAAGATIVKTIGDAAEENQAIQEWVDGVTDSMKGLSVAVGTDLARALGTLPIEDFIDGLGNARNAAVDFIAGVGRQVTFGVFESTAGKESAAELARQEAAEKNFLRQQKGRELYRTLDSQLVTEGGGAAAEAERSARKVEDFFKAIAEAQKQGLDAEQAIELRARAQAQAERAIAKAEADRQAALGDELLAHRLGIAEARADGPDGNVFAEEAAHLRRTLAQGKAQRSFDGGAQTGGDRSVLDAQMAAIQARYEAEIRQIREAGKEEALRQAAQAAADRDSLHVMMAQLEIDELRNTNQDELARKKAVELDYERRIADVRALSVSEAEKASAIAALTASRDRSLAGGGGATSSTVLSASAAAALGGRVLGGAGVNTQQAELTEARKHTQLLREIADAARRGGGSAVYG